MHPSPRMLFSARWSRSAVEIPGFTASSRRSMVSAVTVPARRIRSISSGDLKTITRVPSGQVAQRRQGPRGHAVLGAVGVDLPEEAAFGIELEQGCGALPVDLEAPSHRRLLVVGPLDEPSSARVAHP